MAKLTKTQHTALTWFAENDGAKFIPIHISRVVRDRLVKAEYLKSNRPFAFGLSTFFITEAGRAALQSTEEM
jgi:hypothetical protein